MAAASVRCRYRFRALYLDRPACRRLVQSLRARASVQSVLHIYRPTGFSEGLAESVHSTDVEGLGG